MSLPPGPRSAAFQSLRYMLDPYGHYARLRRRYGDLFTMPTLNGTVVITCTPEGAREILAGREEDFVVGFGVDALLPLLGPDSLLLLSGDAHRRERKLLSPTFHGNRMRAYAPAMRESAERLVDSWTPGRCLKVQDEASAFSLDVIIRVVIGARSDERVAELREAIREGVAEVNPVPLFFTFMQREFGGLGPWARFMKRKARVDALLDREIREARRSDAARDDILSKLVRTRYEDGSAPSDAAIRDQLRSLLVAGHETTATTLAWACYELTRQPEVVARLRDEIGDEGDPEKLAALPYLEAFCRETLRLHPIVPEFFRTVKTSFPLQGYEIPSGVTLAGAILAIHQNPDLYPEPERFVPERFIERRFAPHEFAAFGGSHRHCIGAAFALTELAVVLGTLIPRVDLRLALDRPLRTVRRHVTLGPEAGVPVEVQAVGRGGARRPNTTARRGRAARVS